MTPRPTGVALHQPVFPPEDETMGAMHDRWALAVGRLLLAFGEIEHTTDECLSLFPRDSIFEAIAGMPLSRRLALVRGILVGRHDLAQEIAPLTNILDRVENLVTLRNTVAHNPMVMAFYKMDEAGDLRIADELPSKKGNRRYTYQDIANAAAAAQSISLDMIETYYSLYNAFARDKPNTTK